MRNLIGRREVVDMGTKTFSQNTGLEQIIPPSRDVAYSTPTLYRLGKIQDIAKGTPALFPISLKDRY